MDTVSENAPVPGPVDPRELRVSDAERTHVVEVLQKAIGQGLITLEEFSDRTDTALAARTRGELNVVLVDLPGLTHRDNVQAQPRRQPVELRSTMSAVKRTGAWNVPDELLIRSRMGSTELDFTEATITGHRVNIELDVAGGSVELLIPEGASVSTDGLQMTAGALKDKVGRVGDGHPHFMVSGTVRAGSVEIRRPTYVRVGALVVRFPWRMSWDPQ